MKNRVITLLPPLLQYGIRVSPHFITSPSFQFQIIIISKIFSQRVNILLKKHKLLIKIYFPDPIFNGDELLQIKERSLPIHYIQRMIMFPKQKYYRNLIIAIFPTIILTHFKKCNWFQFLFEQRVLLWMGKVNFNSTAKDIIPLLYRTEYCIDAEVVQFNAHWQKSKMWKCGQTDPGDKGGN